MKTFIYHRINIYGNGYDKESFEGTALGVGEHTVSVYQGTDIVAYIVLHPGEFVRPA